MVLIIAANDDIGRSIAGDLRGTYTVMEEIEGKFMAKWLDRLVDTEPTDYAYWLFEFAKTCHCGHGALEPTPVGKRYKERRTASDLLTLERREPCPHCHPGARQAPCQPPPWLNWPPPCDVIPATAPLRLHDHEAWYDVKTAIREAIARGDDKRPA